VASVIPVRSKSVVLAIAVICAFACIIGCFSLFFYGQLRNTKDERVVAIVTPLAVSSTNIVIDGSTYGLQGYFVADRIEAVIATPISNCLAGNVIFFHNYRYVSNIPVLDVPLCNTEIRTEVVDIAINGKNCSFPPNEYLVVLELRNGVLEPATGIFRSGDSVREVMTVSNIRLLYDD
jgi:hypothetical protein